MPGKPRTNFFEQLKRRSVLRVAFAYIVGAWVVIQVADTVFPNIGLPDRAITFVIVVVAIGFIPALIVAWFFELTPDGIVRDEGPDEAESGPAKRRLRTFDYAVLSVMTIMVAVYTFDKLSPPESVEIAGVDPGFTSSIAVLPFENRSANPDDVYFVDGIHDDILTSLANIGSLRVISRTSVERFRDPDRSIPDIGAELGVDAILEGGVQRAGDTIRVNVQLIDVATDAHLWAQPFDRQLTIENVFAIQSEIATTIAAELQATLSPEEETRLARMPTDNLDAYEAYLLGNQRIQRRTGASLDEAVKYFEGAIGLDPGFALAHVGLADSIMLQRLYANRSRDELLEPALTAATRAIELDPNNGEAHATLAQIHQEFDTGIDPDPLFRKALELSPNYAPGRQWYAEFLSSQGRSDEAMAQMQIALGLDPLSPIINVMLGEFHFDRGELSEQKARILRAIEIDPLFARGYGELAFAYRATGQWAIAMLAAQEAYRLNPASTIARSLQADLFVQLGDLDAAAQIVAEVNSLAPEQPLSRFATAMLHTVRNDDEAFQYALDNWDDAGRRGFYVGILVTGYLRKGQPEEALELIDSIDGRYSIPSEPHVAEIRNSGSAASVIAYAHALRAAGRNEEATPWIQALLELYGDDYRPDPGDTNLTQNDLRYLVDKAQVLALSDDREGALAAMRQAVDAGWSRNWIYIFDHAPSLDLIRDEPEFVAMKEEVAARMAEQLRAYRAGEITVP